MFILTHPINFPWEKTRAPGENHDFRQSLESVASVESSTTAPPLPGLTVSRSKIKIQGFREFPGRTNPDNFMKFSSLWSATIGSAGFLVVSKSKINSRNVTLELENKVMKENFIVGNCKIAKYLEN
jgi:hypothetical protein